MITHAPSPARRLAPELALLGLLALLWGGSYPLSKTALEEIPPQTLVAIRLSVAAAVLWVVLLIRRVAVPRRPVLWRQMAVQACLNSAIPFSLLAWALTRIDSGLGGVLNSTSPLFVVLFAYALGRPETLRRRFGAMLGMAGVVLIIGVEALDGLGADLLAQGAALLGAAIYGTAALYGQRFRDEPALATAACTLTIAAAILLPPALIVDQPWTLRPSAEALAIALALGLFSTGLAFLIYFRLIRTLGSLGVASQAYLRAAVALAIGVLILGETLSWSAAAGVALAIAGVAAINAPVGLFKRRGDPR